MPLDRDLAAKTKDEVSPAPPVHPTFLTQSGHLFHYLTPLHSELTVVDIAHALGHLCRFGGHTKAFYSYAQHAVLVSRLVPAADALAALFYDAPKAVLGNVQTALKPLLPDYQALEERMLRAMYQKLNLAWPAPPSLRPAALVVRATERRDVLPQSDQHWPELDGISPLDERIVPLAPEAARAAFLRRHQELTPARVRLALV